MTDRPPPLPATGPASSPQQKTPAVSVWSLVLGILSIFCLWIIGSIPAIIMGSIGIKKANENPQEVGGKGLALAGIITGSVGILTGLVTFGIYAAMIIPATVTVQNKTQEAHTISEMKELALAIQIYSLDRASYPDSLDQLIPDFLDSGDLIYQVNPDTGERSEILYQPLLEGEDQTETAILLSPFPVEGKRFVGFADGRVETIFEPLSVELQKRFE